MLRNRRIGASVAGVADFVDQRGLPELRGWLNRGYEEVQRRDAQYSEWLCVRTSIKTTTVKPGGSVPLLAGVSPGLHRPVFSSYFRRIRLARGEPLAVALLEAGYHVEPSVNDPANTVIVELPVLGLDTRTQSDVTVWEQAGLAADMQRWWADNQVSVTLSFNAATEGPQLGALLHSFEGQLKSASFFARADDEPAAYAQMPYETAPRRTIFEKQGHARRLDVEAVYGVAAPEPVGERFCDGDSCEI
jgi:hypothetical protein